VETCDRQLFSDLGGSGSNVVQTIVAHGSYSFLRNSREIVLPADQDQNLTHKFVISVAGQFSPNSEIARADVPEFIVRILLEGKASIIN
jgi:hypothetical protein